MNRLGAHGAVLRLGVWLVIWGLMGTGSVAWAQRVNLARFQDASASSSLGGEPALYATDGIVSKSNRWKSDGPGPHWLKVTLPLPMEIGSAHVFTGSDDDNAMASFTLQYRQGANWVDVPGASVSGNVRTELNLVFAQTITASEVRLYTTESTARVKELAFYPPHGPAGYPLGTDVVLNLAWQRETSASSIDGDDYPKRAVDGYLDNNSRWVAQDTAGDDTLEVTLSSSHRIGSAHVHTGFGTGSPPVSEFRLQYWDGNSWLDIPGAGVVGNTQLAVRLDFASPVTASRVRFISPGAGRKRLQELVFFTANGGAGYPLGTGVSVEPRPQQSFRDYGDAYYKLTNRKANRSLVTGPDGATLTTALTVEEAKHLQVLLNVDTDTYRIRNRLTGDCLEVLGASRADGATVVERPYTGMPHQQWRLAPVDAADFQVVNVWSGHVLGTTGGATEEGTPVVQTVTGADPSQQWRITHQTHYPKKGLAGWFGQAERMQPSWGYDWGRSSGMLPNGGLMMPMQHNAYWPGWGSLPENYPVWNSRSRPTFMLGFNEPDRPDQADMSIAQVLDLWPRLERLNIPLVSPVTSNPWNSWMTGYMDQADALGYRAEYVAVHWYGSPNGGNAQGFVDWLWGIQDRYRRPIWLTEFSTVDWNGTASWTEEDNYNFFAEFFWRAEGLSWLSKYSMFIFSGNPPANPDDAVAPRGNIFLSDNATFTALGELYAAWDGDTIIREETPYLVHNKRQRQRLRNAPGFPAPSVAWIRLSDQTVQWALVAAGSSRYYLVSLENGTRLRTDGTSLGFAPPGTIGPEVEWRLIESEHGWFYLDHPTTGTRLQLTDQHALQLVSNSTTGDALKWRFIKPVSPSELDPDPPPPPSDTLVAAGAIWKYWDQGGIPSLSWRSSSYDDSSWSSGPARLGYGGDGEVTVLSFGADPNNKHVTTFFRKSFTVANPARYTDLIVRLQRDDGAIVFLNGTEIFRSNLPATVSPLTLASSVVSGAAEAEWFEAPAHASLLVTGLNQLAVQVHQATVDSSDLGFDLELRGQLPQPAPIVLLTSPLPDGIFGTPGTFQAAADASDATSSVQRVEFYLDGQLAGSDGTPPYALDIIDPAVGLHQLSAVAVNLLGAAATSGPVQFSVVQATTTNTLLPAGSLWKYHDQGVDLGTSWRMPGYDDTGWAEGPAKLGFGDNALTLIDLGPDGARHPTAYFRTSFSVAEVAPVDQLHFRVLRDDGVVVHLNGTEVFRMNMPEGPVAFADLAASTVSGDNESRYYDVTVQADALLSGLNVLAAELHQAGIDTSDAGFDLELGAVKSILGQIPTSLSLEKIADGDLRISWRSPASNWVLYQGVYMQSRLVWLPASGTVESNGGYHSMMVPILGKHRFFQLRLE